MNALITGGASCGKSQIAEDLCQSLGGNLVYLAAMRPHGEEAAVRIRRHRAQRAGKGFSTVECGDGLAVALANEQTLGATALLEDLGNVVANRLFNSQECADVDNLDTEIESNLDMLSRRCKHLIVVGNEVGSDGVIYGYETREYQVLLGRVARMWATRCDLVQACTCGIPATLSIGGEAFHESIA